jgi:hypothetical protein
MPLLVVYLVLALHVAALAAVGALTTEGGLAAWWRS